LDWEEKFQNKKYFAAIEKSGLLNNLFMVEVGVSDKNVIHTDVDTMAIANTSRCIEKVDARQEVIIQKGGMSFRILEGPLVVN
jgi:hypothetical protein